MRVLAVVVAGHVTGNHHHRDRVQRRIGHAGGGVGEARAEVAEHHGGGFFGAGVAVSGVCGHLFVTRVDELDAAFSQRGQHCNVGVAAQAKNVLDTPVFEVFDELVRNQVLHGLSPA